MMSTMSTMCTVPVSLLLRDNVDGAGAVIGASVSSGGGVRLLGNRPSTMTSRIG